MAFLSWLFSIDLVCRITNSKRHTNYLMNASHNCYCYADRCPIQYVRYYNVASISTILTAGSLRFDDAIMIKSFGMLSNFHVKSGKVDFDPLKFSEAAKEGSKCPIRHLSMIHS